MKKIIKYLGIAIFIMSFAIPMRAQITNVSHLGATLDWVGWNIPSAMSLEIRDDGNYPINFWTNTNKIATVTTNSFFSYPGGINAGDGIRIWDPFYSWGNLDLWTSSFMATHIQFGHNGHIDGQNNRLEMTGYLTGLWLDANTTTLGPARIWFNLEDNEVGRFSPTHFMRIGDNTGNVDALRRLEVVDPSNLAQFRISQSSFAGTDFQTTSAGMLKINPSGSGVGINIFTANLGCGWG